MATLEVDIDGYTDLPPGRLANFATYLEMTAPPGDAAAPTPPGVSLEPIGADGLDRYRALFAAVGEDWLWFGRRGLDDTALAAILGDPAVCARAVIRDGRDVGLVELDGRTAGEIELAYFGLIPQAIGAGLGRWLMNTALRDAWASAPRRVWLHTCSFDHPGALGFYRRAGFRPYKFALEMMPDPRLTGLLPRSAAPQIPLIEA